MKKVAVAGNQILGQRPLALNSQCFTTPTTTPHNSLYVYLYYTDGIDISVMVCSYCYILFCVELGFHPLGAMSDYRLTSFPDSPLLSGESLGTRL